VADVATAALFLTRQLSFPCLFNSVNSVVAIWSLAKCFVVTWAHARTLLGNGSSRWWWTWSRRTLSSSSPSNKRLRYVTLC